MQRDVLIGGMAARVCGLAKSSYGDVVGICMHIFIHNFDNMHFARNDIGLVSSE